MARSAARQYLCWPCTPSEPRSWHSWSSTARISRRMEYTANTGLAQLLGDPGVGRVARHADMHHLARAERDHEGGIDRPEERVRDGEAVARPDRVGVVAQEGRPRLARPLRRASVAHVFLHGPLGDTHVQLQQL